MKKILLILILTIMIFPKSVFASTVEEQQRAVLATANAYYNQKSQLQYDSYRKNLYSTPEDATSKHTVYTVCSGFTFMTYYQALGIKLPDTTEELLDYAEKYKNSDNVIFYYGSKSEIYKKGVLGAGSDSVTSEEKQVFVNSIIKKVKPGDIFVYYGTSGHAMLVKSVDTKNKKITLMDADGSRYNFDDHVDGYEEDGAINDGVNLISKLYANRTRMALFRIINAEQKYTNYNGETINYEITAAAKTRMSYQNIDIGKIINNVDNQSFAGLGDELTYQLRIRNKGSKAYTNLNVVENIDPRLQIVSSGNGVITGNQITWNISSIAPGEYVTLLYTVKVPINQELINNIIVSTGNVNGIATSKIETLIGKRLLQSQKDKLQVAFNSIKNTSKATTSRGFINELFDKAFSTETEKFNLGISELTNLSVLSYNETNKSGGKNNLSVKYTTLADTMKKYLYSNFYGLRIAENHNPAKNYVKASNAWNVYPIYELNDRARTLKSSMLEDGDIVLAYVGRTSTTDTNMGNKGYVYLNKTLYRFKEGNTFEKLTGDKLETFLANLVGENYIILRPYLKNIIGINIASLPSKIEYPLNTSSINLTQGSINILYDDGTQDKVSLTRDNISISGFKSNQLGPKTITVNYEGHTTSFDVQIVEKKPIKIEMYKSPLKTSYIANVENLDVTGGEIKVIYEDNTTEIISLKSKDVKVMNFNNAHPGTSKVLVRYKDLETTFSVRINEQKATVVIESKPYKVTYFQNSEHLDLSGGVLTIVQGDGTKERISLENENVKITGFDNTKVGINNITVEYEGKTTQIPVEIIDKKITSINVEKAPLKTNYVSGYDHLDLTGGVLEVIYDDGTTDKISLTNENVLVTGFDNTTVGSNNITIKYRDNITTMNLNIVDKKITGIELSSKPVKTTYIVNKENLDLTYGELSVKYDDGTTDRISLTNPNVKVIGFDNTKIGTNSIEIEYASYKTKFEVEIIKEYELKEKNNSEYLNYLIIMAIFTSIVTAISLRKIYLRKKSKREFVPDINE